MRPSLRLAIAAVAARHPRFEYTLIGRATWPDTTYVAVEPVAAFVRLQADLASAFPGFPIYGTEASFEFVPHVTVGLGVSADGPAMAADPAWRALPTQAVARAVEVIVRAPGERWRTLWRVPLRG